MALLPLLWGVGVCNPLSSSGYFCITTAYDIFVIMREFCRVGQVICIRLSCTGYLPILEFWETKFLPCERQ